MEKSKLRRFGDCKLPKYPLGEKKRKKKTDESKDQNDAVLGKIRVSPFLQKRRRFAKVRD
jgi:hypothetical protein